MRAERVERRAHRLKESHPDWTFPECLVRAEDEAAETADETDNR